MEVKINKEIRDYTESIFFGLSMRQFFFSVLAVIAAVAVYFLLKPVLGLETASWVCVLAAVPFGAMGFIKYNGMTAEKFLMVWFRDQFLTPKKLTFGNTNIWYGVLRPEDRKKRKEMTHVQSTQKRTEKR
nr:PrgI family protein [Clostridia bacterium]